MFQQVCEATEAIKTKEAAHDRAEAWAGQITQEVAAHTEAVQRVDQAELAHSTQPSTQTATRVADEKQRLNNLRRKCERVCYTGCTSVTLRS